MSLLLVGLRSHSPHDPTQTRLRNTCHNSTCHHSSLNSRTGQQAQLSPKSCRTYQVTRQCRGCSLLSRVPQPAQQVPNTCRACRQGNHVQEANSPAGSHNLHGSPCSNSSSNAWVLFQSNQYLRNTEQWLRGRCALPPQLSKAQSTSWSSRLLNSSRRPSRRTPMHFSFWAESRP